MMDAGHRPAIADFSRRVAARFGNAAASYDTHSTAQRHAAQRLGEHIAALGLPPRPRVLEIGCGTGHLTEQLTTRLDGATILATDLAPAMVDACRTRLGAHPRLAFATMDGAHPAVPGCFDLICGNLVAQWFTDLPAACARLAGLLAPGGALVLSLPGGGTFREWRAAHARLGLPAGTYPMPTSADCRAALPAHGDGRVEVEHWIDRPVDGLAFLRSLRAIGADTPAPGHAPLSPARLRRVLRELGPAPTLTYELIFMLHRQPS